MSVKLKLNSEQASQKLKRTAVFHLNAAAASTQTIARELAPVRTGFMRDHILQTELASEDSLRTAVESQADYSAHVEFGTVNQAAQPFFVPAFESAKRQLSKVRGVF